MSLRELRRGRPDSIAVKLIKRGGEHAHLKKLKKKRGRSTGNKAIQTSLRAIRLRKFKKEACRLIF